MVYVVRDRASQGADFILWGCDEGRDGENFDLAVLSLVDAISDGLAVELLVAWVEDLDDRTAHMIGPERIIG